MFLDSDAWPPPPGGAPSPPPRDPARERRAMIAVGFLLFAVLIGPFAGTSIVAVVLALTGGR